MAQAIRSLRSVLAFDGQNAQITLGRKPEFKIQRDITLEAWIYCEAQRRRTGIVTNVYDTTWVEDELVIGDRQSNIELGVAQNMANKKEEKTPPTSSKTEKSKTESKKISPAEKAAEVIKCSSSATGLEDYGFWCDQVKKERAARTEPDPPFRRGRIWA